ncbi:MAG TPA: septum formation initiator family protein [Ktedonobacteraceae bacterium]|jgi:cell division protein FtsL|nr:septum formation initiator family protein [Ktedonobacteraceae bacterium]
MYNLKKRNATQRNTAAQPIVVAQRRRQLYPLFFHMGPVALCITSVCLIGLMAVLYLSQVGRAEAANQQIQDIHAQQANLQRQNQDLMYQIARERSPEYIAEQAQKQGLVPADPEQIQTLAVPNLRPIPKNDPTFSP